MRVITGCLLSIPIAFLPVQSGITPSETRRSASGLKLYTKALNRKHLLHETLYLKPPKRLRSYVELLSINGEPSTPILHSRTRPTTSRLRPPRKAWVHLKRLRLVLADLQTSNYWACVDQICVNVARCRLHTTSCIIAPNSNLRATSMR